MNVIFIHGRESMIWLNPIKRPVNGLGYLAKYFKIEDFPLVSRRRVETTEDIIFRIYSCRDGTFAINIGGNIVYMSHLVFENPSSQGSILSLTIKRGQLPNAKRLSIAGPITSWQSHVADELTEARNR